MNWKNNFLVLEMSPRERHKKGYKGKDTFKTMPTATDCAKQYECKCRKDFKM